MSGMQKTPYYDFATNVLKLDFEDIDLLILALTHRSYVNEHKKSVKEHNERLEFLGDAVLELVVTEYLFKNFPEEQEGILTSWRAALVRTESISEAGSKLGFQPLIRMSKGEKQGGDRAKKQILANAFEAVVGAIYLEKGYDAAQVFINEHIIKKLPGILDAESWRDPKSYLQEVSQRVDNHTPQYKVLDETGPDHDKIFTLGVFVGEKLLAKGQGASKQAAQQEAARLALKTYDK
jgi:ribonuclease-3